MRKILIGFFGGVAMLGLVGCTSYIPYSSELSRVRNTPYEKGKNDCKHKSLEDHQFLELKGEDSKLIFGKLGNGMHIWQEVYNSKKDTWHVRDATAKYSTGGFEISQYPKRQRGKWGAFEDEVNIQDIKNYDKIKEVYWKNVPKRYESFLKRKMGIIQ